MGLLELFGDNNSEDVGTIEKTEHTKKIGLVPAVIIKGIIGIGLLTLSEWGIVVSGYPILLNILLLIYLVIAYNVDPKPRMDKLGLLGGLIDHPFKYTDDINRSMLFFKIILFPGKVIGTSIVDLIKGILKYIIDKKNI